MAPGKKLLSSASKGWKLIASPSTKMLGVTQLGSTFHYHIGNILEKDGLTLADVKIVPLQAMPATMEALKGKQVDAILVPQPFPGAAEAQGFGRIMAWAGDLYPWQIATIFYSGKLAADRPRAVAFMKGYVKASRYYFDAALIQKDGRPCPASTMRRSSRSPRATPARGPRSSSSASPTRIATAGCLCPTSSGRLAGGPPTGSSKSPCRSPESSTPRSWRRP